MTKLERHRFLLYGRIGGSILLYITSMIVGASTALTATSGTAVWIAGGLLVVSVVLLPRSAVPQGEQAREEVSDQELDHYRRIRSWLTWTRLAYLLIAIGVLVGLPELL